METEEKPQLYTVRKIMKISGRKSIIEKNLTLEQAKRLVKTQKSTRSMLVFNKQ